MTTPKKNLLPKRSVTLLIIATILIVLSLMTVTALMQSTGQHTEHMDRIASPSLNGKNTPPEVPVPPVKGQGGAAPQVVEDASSYVFATATNASFTDMSS